MEVITQAAQAHDILTNGAVAHFSLFYQKLFKAHNIEEIIMSFAMQIATKTAQRRPLLLFFLPLWLIHGGIKASNFQLVNNLPAAHKSDAIEQFAAVGTMRLDMFKVFQV